MATKKRKMSKRGRENIGRAMRLVWKHKKNGVKPAKKDAVWQVANPTETDLGYTEQVPFEAERHKAEMASLELQHLRELRDVLLYFVGKG